MNKYETDLVAWALEQAEALRRQRHNLLDWENLAEEIESVGLSQKKEVRSRLTVICKHLLKWQYQPEHRSRSWRSSIRTQRRDLEDVLKDSPSLRPYAEKKLEDAFKRGREEAEDETGLLHLPSTHPWSIEQVLDCEFWPGGKDL